MVVAWTAPDSAAQSVVLDLENFLVENQVPQVYHHHSVVPC